MPSFNRRKFLATAVTGAASATLYACSSVRSRHDSAYGQTQFAQPIPLSQFNPDIIDERQIYVVMQKTAYEIPAVPVDKIDPKYRRQLVADPTGEQPGTIVVDTSNHFLYLVGGWGEALRYG